MKLGKTTLNNTDQHLIDLLAQRDWVTAEQIVRATYANSKQVDKKAATYTKRLRRLQRFGYVREIRGAWALTSKNGISPPSGGRPQLRIAAA